MARRSRKDDIERLQLRGATLAPIAGGVIIVDRKGHHVFTNENEALQHKNERTIAILESISDAFFALDDQLVVTYFNTAAEQVLGRKREDVVGHPLFQTFREAKGSIFEEMYTRAAREKVPLAFEEYFGIAPYENWYDVRVYPQEDGISVYFRVTTERKQAEAALRASEERYRGLYQAAPVAYFTVAVDGRIRLANRRAIEMLGYAEQDLVGRPVFDLYADTAAGKQNARHVFERFRAGQDIHGEELEMRRVDGSSLWVSLTVLPVRDAKGQVVESRSMALDITQRRLADQLIQDARAYAESIVETVREPLLVLSADLRVKSANRSFYRTFHVLPEETENRPIFELGSGQWNIPRLRDLLGEILGKNTRLDDFEVEGEFPVIGRRTMLLNARRLVQEADRGQLILLAAEDVTERKQAEQFREEYLSLIAHDLRSPLTVIIGTADLLRRRLAEQASASEGATAERILTSGRRMESMIRDLAASARLEQGQLKILDEPIDLLRLIDDLSKRVGTAEDQARLRVESPDWVPPALADAAQVERAITNILTNALKYSPVDTPVVVRVGRREGQAMISVTDQGVGILPEDLPQIFQRHFRAKTAGKQEGLGLGLYITRLIVEAHGGKVWVESEVGRGSIFYVTLPLAQPYCVIDPPHCSGEFKP